MNEDDDEANAVGATRYPCMPSLISLQQMRNRHQLAQLGKKLMNWTALATGRELRRINEDLNLTYANFGDDVSECYILLARSRYFYPNLNQMVIGNVPKQASIRVSTFTKTVAGVKILQYEIIDTGHEPYQHLAIDKGGQIVKDAKDEWVELLKRMIIIVQLRQGFKQVDEANRSATKRQNVLSKTVIPRVLSSIRYIILELEELAREELYRIKKVVEFKKKKKDKLLEQNSGAAKLPKVIFTEVEPQRKTVTRDEASEPVPDIPEPIIEHIKPDICSHPSQSTADYLKEQLASVISLSKDLMTSKIRTIDFGSFLKHCEKVKEGISEVLQSEKPLKLSEEDSEKQSLIGDDLVKRLEDLKSHLGSVIEISKEFREKVNISPSVEDFNNLCQTVYDKLDLFFQDIRSPKVSVPPKDRLECLKEHIKDTEELTEEYKSQGIITSGSEKFLDACAHIKSRIESYKNDKNADKLQHLKDHVSDLEQLTTGIKEDGMTSESIEEFLLACKEFKARIAKYKTEDRTPPSDGKITKLIDQINTAIELSNAAKESGLVSDSVQDFIQSCEDVKQRLEQKSQHREQPTILRELRANLEDVVNLISELKARGSITTSVENFLKSCQDTKTKIDDYGKKQTYDDNSDSEFMYPTYNSTVSNCENDPGFCEKCEIWIEEASEASSRILPPCKTCAESESSTILSIETQNTPTPTEPKETSDKEKSVEIITPEILNDSQSLTCNLSENLSKPSIDSSKKPIDVTNSGSIGKKVKIIARDPDNRSKNDVDPTEPCCCKTVETPPKVDDNLGLFEKKVKKIVKITRTLNKDGTVKEEQEETITINVRHDPNEKEFDDVMEQASKAGFEER